MRFTRLLSGLLLPAIAAGIGHAQTRWVGSWAASQQVPEPHNSLAADDLRDAVLRQVVHLSIGGTELRVHLSNRFGAAPLHFTSVHIARPVSAASGKIDSQTDKALAFAGSQDVIVPQGADYISDPVAFSAAAMSDLAISLHIDQAPVEQTGHPGSRSTSWLGHGDLVSAAEIPDAKKVEHWYFISGVDVAASPQAAAVVVLGDSITDGHGATTNENNRWPDFLARRLQASPPTRGLAVLNHGIGGNRLLLDGLGPNALARFDHDVLAQAGVQFLIVLEGINDIGTLAREREVSQEEHDALVRRMKAAYQQIIERAHAHHIRVIGGTLLPFVASQYYHPSAKSEADRQAVNQWIRDSGRFDAVIDFDKITRDPEHPDRLLPAFDSGDHLHPSPAGFAAMAEGIPLTLLNLPASQAAPLKMAITFDDLPAHGPLPPGETRVGVISRIIAALQGFHVPSTYGFVNGSLLDKEPEDLAVLQAWRAAGYPLGNHTWSHMNLNQHTPEEFEQDVSRNESLISGLMKKKDWHWFRFPFLAEGETPVKKSAVRDFLARRGYKIASVTMSFGDFQWNEPYARCRAKGDATAVASLDTSFLTAADESIHFYRELSWGLYNRDIPYVLLMHVGAFDAEMLPKLLDLYRSRGFEFVTLAEAEADQFYRGSTDLHSPPGPDTLEGLMGERHFPLPCVDSAVQLDSICR